MKLVLFLHRQTRHFPCGRGDGARQTAQLGSPLFGMGLLVSRRVSGGAYTTPQDLLGPRLLYWAGLGHISPKLIAPSPRFNLAFTPRMVTFPKEQCSDPSQIFWYSDLVKFRSFKFSTDLSIKKVVKCVVTCPLYLLTWWLIVPVSLSIETSNTYMPSQLLSTISI